MFNTIMMEFELGLMENSNVMECAKDRFSIAAAEMANLKNRGYYVESSSDFDDSITVITESFIEKVQEFFKGLIQKVKDLVKSLEDKFKEKMVSREINKKMTEIKQRLANKKTRMNMMDVKMPYTDTKAYMKAYKKYIDGGLSIFKKLYNKEYENYDEYAKAYAKLASETDKLALELGIDDYERYEIAVGVDTFYEYTKDEINSIKSINAAYKKMQEDYLVEMQKLAEKEDDISKISDIQSQATKTTSKFGTVIRKVISSPITKVATLAATVGGVTVAYKKHQNDKISEL
jgi:hypothetical protein